MANLHHYLRGVDYPTDKVQLLQVAEHNNAPDDVVDQLRALPAQEFGGPDDVMKAVAH